MEGSGAQVRRADRLRPMSQRSHWRAARPANALIGSPIERVEDLRFLRGKGEYVDDVTRPGLLHAVILRSSVAHGRIVAIDTGAALARSGVHAVITAADIGGVPTIPLRQEQLEAFRPFEQPVIATGTVRYVGEPVAVVVADSAALAEDAAEAVTIDIASLPVVADRATAERGTLLFGQTGSNLAGTLTAVKGDADAAFRAAAYVRREQFQVQRHTAVPMELRGIVAEWNDGRLTFHGAAKVPFPNRRILAKQLGVPEAAVRMVENDVGGGFGVRGEFYPEDFLIPFAARLIGRPVKWIEDRREHLIATNHARDVACELEIACDQDGTILALRGHAKADVGAYLRTNGATGARNTAQILSGPYRVPNIHMRVSLLVTNKTPVGTYRGPGRFEADFFRERLFDMAANDLGIDPVAFRRRNLIAETEMPYPLARVVELNLATQTDSGDYRVTLERCLEEIGWAAKSPLQGKPGRRTHVTASPSAAISKAAHRGRAKRRASCWSATGRCRSMSARPPTGRGWRRCSARSRPMRWNCRSIASVACSMARPTACAKASAATVRAPSSWAAPRSSTPPASCVRRSAPRQRAGSAVRRATSCSRTARRAARSEARSRFADLAADEISAEGSYASAKRTYSYGAHAAHVAVDPRTGAVEVIDYVAVEDVGRIINPATLHGQAVGAIVQGLGGVFLEHLVYDAEGQLLTGSLADYLMPTANDFPVIRAVALEESPAPHNPLGAKGAGEGGIIPVGGVIANAVAAALRPLGVEPRELPLSPPRLWALIAGARRRG